MQLQGDTTVVINKIFHFLFVKQHWEHTQIDSFVKVFTKYKFQQQKKDTNLHK